MCFKLNFPPKMCPFLPRVHMSALVWHWKTLKKELKESRSGIQEKSTQTSADMQVSQHLLSALHLTKLERCVSVGIMMDCLFSLNSAKSSHVCRLHTLQRWTTLNERTSQLRNRVYLCVLRFPCRLFILMHIGNITKVKRFEAISATEGYFKTNPC